MNYKTLRYLVLNQITWKSAFRYPLYFFHNMWRYLRMTSQTAVNICRSTFPRSDGIKIWQTTNPWGISILDCFPPTRVLEVLQKRQIILSKYEQIYMVSHFLTDPLKSSNLQFYLLDESTVTTQNVYNSNDYIFSLGI